MRKILLTLAAPGIKKYKAKAIKRSMYNRANADVLRAKMIYAGLKWDWNYHLN